MMDIYSLLVEDHNKVKNIITCLEGMGNSDEEVEMKEDIFSYLRAEIIVHSKAEEEAFYDRLVQASQQEDRIEHSRKEHKTVEKLLGELSNCDKDSKEWSETLKKLRKELEHHIQEEENEIFGYAKKVFSAKQAKEIAHNMLAEKGKWQMRAPLAVAQAKMKDMVS